MIENQYIELFLKNKNLLDKASNRVINDAREIALNKFKEIGFPSKRDEDYQNSNIANKFRVLYSIDLANRAEFNPYTESYFFSIKDLTSLHYYTINSSLFDKDIPQPNSNKKGVFIGGFNDFIKLYPDIFSKYYGQLVNQEKDSLAFFNTMFVENGFVLYLPENAIIEEPIQLTNLLKDKRGSLLVNRRILIIAGINSQAKVLTNDFSADNNKYLVTQVTEIYADENAHIDFYELEETSDNNIRLTSTFVKENKGASVLVNNITIRNGFSRNNYNVKLAGENSEAYVAGIVVAEKEQHVDNFVFLDHLKPHCTSTQLFKYILQDKSLGSFCGRIRVEKDAQKTLAYQTNNNLCISPSSKMFSKPQLEIYADDVKCSHGLTTGQLDEDALFYMRARGIPREDAKLLLMQAFTSDVLSLIRLESLHDKLVQIIEDRFQK